MAARIRIYAPTSGVDEVGFRYNGSGTYTYAAPLGTDTPCIDEDEVIASSVQVRANLPNGWRVSQWVINADGETSTSTSSAPNISLSGVTNLFIRLEVEKIQTYTISAYVSFNAQGGSVYPTYDENSKETTESWGYVDITFPTPTRSGYTFLYWLLDGYTTHYGAGTHSIYASSDGKTYTARAQWERTGTGKAFIGDGGVWKQAVPFIGDGGAWKPATENIGDGETWK